jgi:hypothetical protein
MFHAPQLRHGARDRHVALLPQRRLAASIFSAHPHAGHVGHRRAQRHVVQKLDALGQRVHERHLPRGAGDGEHHAGKASAAADVDDAQRRVRAAGQRRLDTGQQRQRILHVARHDLRPAATRTRERPRQQGREGG